MRYFDLALEHEPFTRTAERLRAEVDGAMPQLAALSDPASSIPRAPGKWSRKETLGHLIDSASNNHQRFVRAQEGPVLRLRGYAVDHWITVQRYNDRPWSDIVALWASYNRHIVHVIALIPEAQRETICEIGIEPPVPLRHLVLDYVGHIQHHLAQIFEPVATAITAPR